MMIDLTEEQSTFLIKIVSDFPLLYKQQFVDGVATLLGTLPRSAPIWAPSELAGILLDRITHPRSNIPEDQLGLLKRLVIDARRRAAFDVEEK